MPRTNEPMSDVTRNACRCAAHDILFQAGQGAERDMRLDVEAPLSLAMWEHGPESICRHWRDTVFLHAMIASGATCEALHRAGSGVMVVNTYDRDARFFRDPIFFMYHPRARFRTMDDTTAEGDEA